MKITTHLWALAAGVLWAGRLWAEPVPLSLPDAYALTLQQSETLQIHTSELRASEARYRRATAARWPELLAGGSATFRDVPEGDTQDKTDASAGLSAGWNLFDGFRTLHDVDARRADRDALQFDRARSRQLLYEDVADVFYQVLSLQGEQKALEQQVDALRQRAEELGRRMELGRARRGEWLTVRTQMAETTVTLEQVRGQLDVALEMLSLLTGRPVPELKPVCQDALPGPEAAGAMVSLDEQRPDLEAARRRVVAAQADVAAVRADRHVSVSTDANLYLWQDPDGGDWDVVVRAQVPVFDGGLRRANVAAQREEARIVELKLVQLQRTAAADVRAAARTFQGLLAQWNAIREAETLAKETADTMKQDYEIGRASNLDSLAALVQLHGLSRRAVILEMQLRSARVRLEVAAGRQIQ